MPTPTSNIRNFCIIAHIDHGKSTLADQFLLKTGTISERDINAQMETALMTVPEEVMRVSAKAGIGIEDLLAAVVERVPPPPGDVNAPLKALIYNSHFDTYKGVVVYIRMMDGSVKPGQRIKLMRAGREYVVTEMGQFRPEMVKCDELSAGQVGYFTANIKNIGDVNIGDTVT